MFFAPIDPLLAVLYAAYKLRPVRGVILFFGLIPATLYAMPAQSCGCIRMPFVRCKPYVSPYFAAMKSDLKNLASQQEIYFSDYDTYSADAEELWFTHSHGVDVTIYASDRGWAARTTHAALGEAESCAMYYGSAPPHGIEELADVPAGELVCSS